MKCPNCMFDVQAGTENCPFCNFVIPPPAASPDDPVPVDESGVPTEPAPAPVPVPDPEAMLIEGTKPSEPLPMAAEASPEEPAAQESPASAPASAAKGNAMQLVVVAAAGFLAFKLGLLDNLLMLFGLGSAPPPPPPPVAPPPPGAPAAPAKPAPILLSEPVTPGAGGPVEAPEEAPEADKPPPVSEWTFEGGAYDILSFKPVKGVVLLFMTQTEEETFEAKTDGKGRFKIVLPVRPGGYKLVADHPEYIGEYFDETTPPIKTWSLSRRRQMRAAKPQHAPWAAGDALPVKRDIVLFPDITDR